MKLPIQTIRLTFAFLCLLATVPPAQAGGPIASIEFSPTTAQTRSNQSMSPLTFAAPPLPRGTGAPGRRSDAGRRGCEVAQAATASGEQPLTALAPVYEAAEGNVFGTTIAEYPTFWFYVPYRSPFMGEFVLRDQADTLIYKTSVTLPQESGVIHVALPATVPPLEIGQLYRWYFKVHCESTSPPFFVDGWIQRESAPSAVLKQLETASLPDQVRIYAMHGLWYDALAAAAELHRVSANPSAWVTLLQTIGLSHLESEPIVDCCRLESAG